MYLLKKVIQLRESSHPDHEKPFLEHLEDLRKMVFRVVSTLLVAMIACFAFQKDLMDILRLPVEEVWTLQLEKKLPQDPEDAPKVVSVDDWEQAKRIEHAAAGLDDAERKVFFEDLGDPEMAFHARSVALLRSIQVIPEEKRADYIAKLNIDPDLRKQVTVLNELGPDTDVNPRGNLRLMSALKPTESFVLSMKLAFFAGIVVSFPLLLLFVLQFVLPGLHSNEKRVLWPAMAVGFGLFLGGVLFAYFTVLPRALTFFYEWGGGMGISNDWRIGWYISFATQFTLLFGVAFELPVVVMVFVKLGMLSYETMSRTRSYAVIGILVAAAVLTPTPDAITLSLMAAPMLILYEMCIWLAWLDRRRNRRAAAEEALQSAGLRSRDDTEEYHGHASYDDEGADEESSPDGHDLYEYDKIEDESVHNWEDDYDQFHDFDKEPGLPDDEDAGGEGEDNDKPDGRA